MEKSCGSADAAWMQSLRRLRNHFFDRDIEPLRQILHAHCLKLAKDPALAEDLTQETMLRGFAVCRICGGPKNTQAYLLRVATNLWIDNLRKKKSARKAVDELALMQAPTSPEPAEPLLEVIAAELPTREFEALLLTAVYGYTGAEAARLLRTTPAAIKMATSRARKKLRHADATSTVLR